MTLQHCPQAGPCSETVTARGGGGEGGDGRPLTLTPSLPLASRPFTTIAVSFGVEAGRGCLWELAIAPPAASGVVAVQAAGSSCPLGAAAAAAAATAAAAAAALISSVHAVSAAVHAGCCCLHNMRTQRAEEHEGQAPGQARQAAP